MKSHILTALANEGNDLTAYLNRFEQDEETCELLACMFVNETDFSSYMNAYAQHDITTCIEQIRSLKGSAFNVGLTLLGKKALDILHMLENGDESHLDIYTGELADIYQRTIAILSEE